MQRLIVKSGSDEIRSFSLESGSAQVLGRAIDADCSYPTEACLSRRHMELRSGLGVLEVQSLPNVANPIVFRGETNERFTMTPGDFFVVGATTFHFESTDGERRATFAGSESAPSHAHTTSDHEMRDRGGAADRMRLLDLMELPVILRTKSRAEFFVFACGSMRLATGAEWVQTLWMGDEAPIVLAEDARLDRGARPLSRKLMQQAIDEAPKPTTYCWGDGASDVSLGATAHEGVDWAICCAMPVPGEEPVLFYLAGSQAQGGGIDATTVCDLSLRNTARLVGLVADMVGRAISMEKLERWKSRLGQFFSERVASEILESDAEEALAPRITDATVMFFDIRGFSARTEENFSIREEEDLERILDFTKSRRVVLNVVSQCVVDHFGVIISYAGDGLLACWNVPKPIPGYLEHACLAAIEMTERIVELPGGWQCGIGVGMGQIVAGSLGSDVKEQYDILGAVVNQASRIEGITKVVGVQILVTENVAKSVDATQVMTRRVARFQPAGMTEQIDLFTVDRAPEEAAIRDALANRHTIHTEGLAAFERGDWDEAFKILSPIATEDAPAKYVLSMAVGGKPPKDWQGVIELTSK